MMILHLTEDAAGVSHFSDLAVAFEAADFAPPAPAMGVSAGEPAARLLYLSLPVGWTGARHASPRRQVGICLRGRMRVEAGDGEIREFGPGAVWRMEDVTGSGHVSSVVGDEAVQLAIIQLD